MNKECFKCKVVKEKDQFKTSKQTKDKLHTCCKQCESLYRKAKVEYTKEYNKIYYSNNKEKYSEAHKVYYAKRRDLLISYSKAYRNKRRDENKPAEILSRVRTLAKKYGIPFNLTIEDIIIPKTCPILGIEIIISPIGKGREFLPNCPSIDKIIPNLGYVRGNVRIISHRANTLKSNGTLEEMELILLDLRNIYSSNPPL